MHWWYRLIGKTGSVIRYAYSCESKEYDGVVLYSEKTGNAIMERASITDKGSKWMENRSIRQFYKVVQSGFPEEIHVCCG